MDVAGLRCVVTGAASGIGDAVTRQLVAGGALVTSLDRNPPGADVVEHLEVDLAEPDSIDAAVAGLGGGWDVLANVAGIPGTHPGELVFRVNFLGLRHLTEALVPAMNTGASIVHVSSVAGFGWPARLPALIELMETSSFDEGLAWFEKNTPEGNAYNFSKEAVTVYTLRGGVNLLARGLRMNAVLPGAVQTPILPDFEASMGAEVLAGVKALLGRHGEPEDIAPAVLFLASRASGWCNGSTVTADGGLIGAVAGGLVPAPDIG